MTRRHFKAIAKALRDSRPPCYHALPRSFTLESDSDSHTIRAVQWNGVVQEMARMCKLFNPRFDHSRFLDACGWKGDES